MLTPVLCGALFGLGLWCLLRAVVVPAPPLERALAAIGRSRPAVAPDPAAGGFDGLSHRLALWVMELTGTTLAPLAAELEVLDRSEEHHLIQRVRTGLLYGAFPVVVWLLVWVGAGTSLAHPVVVAVLALVGGAAGWLVTDAQVRTRARRRRTEFDGALVTYLSLVGILLAGGAGIQQALNDAVTGGQGWPFAVLRRALTDARIRGVSPWEAFDRHAARLGLTSLADLAATMELGGTSGAHIREGLLTKARALRNHQLAAIEREAAGRTSAMVGPTGLMLAGFVILLIYPAFRAILSL